MAELLQALSKRYWEIGETNRARFMAEQYPAGLPENYVSLTGIGAQPDLQILRLDPSTLAIVDGSGVSREFPDGEHQFGYQVTVLRRSADGWEDLTAAVFPFPIPPHGNIDLSSDGFVVVTDEHRKYARKYRFDGRCFARVA